MAELRRVLHVGRGAAGFQAPGEGAVVLGHCDYEPPLRLLASGADAAGPQDQWWTTGAPPAAIEAFDDGQGLGWRSDSEWTFGRLQLPESAASAGNDLEALSHAAYTRLFAALAQAGTPQLLRLWNYLPRINQEQAGLERYRRFNLGRQAAFQQAGRSAFDGAPAACALGCPGPADGADGPGASGCSGLTLYFLAGRQPVTPVENPRQVSAYRYPSRYGPSAPTFSRAALADLGSGRTGLFISGTASIVGHETVHLGDVRAQTRETVTNLRTVCEVASQRAGRCFAAEQLELVVYLRHPADLDAVREDLAAALGADSPALRGAIFVQADVCRADLLVEIEAHGLPR